MSKKIWEASKEVKKRAELQRYKNFLEKEYGLTFSDYFSLWQWSIDELESFWESQLNYHAILFDNDYERVLKLPSDQFMGNRWFEGIRLNYAEHVFRNKNPQDLALIYKNEEGDTQYFTWRDIESLVFYFQQFLVDKGVRTGDRVVGILNNTPYTLALFLAVNSLGAIWSCCSPEFGENTILDRFSQIKPTLLFSEKEYQYNGKKISLSESSQRLASSLGLDDACYYLDEKFLKDIQKKEAGSLLFKRVPFNDPIWVLFSSGTTGKPKAITHSVGGILLEHYKALALHQNVQKGDRFLWYSTTGWMMWNYAVSSLLCGATLVLYDGSLHYPEQNAVWEFCKKEEIDHIGFGASFLSQNPPKNVENYYPKTLGSTGSPLPPQTFVEYQKIFPEVHIISLSGGTDVCSAFLSGCVELPVFAGELQCRTLGSDIISADAEGNPLENEIGELAIRQVMPSMPVYFWADEGDKRYKSSYFEKTPGLWCHGDWIRITENKGIIIYGRSDSTLNRGGVRIGTAEIYNILERCEEVQDSLVLTTENNKGQSQMLLFVQMKANFSFDDALMDKIKQELRKQGSPRHVPDAIYEVPDIPYTLSGKKMEIPVKKIVEGVPLTKAVTLEVVKNPESFDYWVGFQKSGQ